MRRFLTLFFHELKILSISPATYIAGVLFLLLQGLIYITLLDDYSRIPQESLPSIEFFKTFWLPVFCMVPLLTMRSLAEERRLGTLESILTTETTPGELVLSKFLSTYCFYIFLWAITLLYPYLSSMGVVSTVLDPRLADTFSWLGGFLFVAVSGLFFIAIGIFCSSLTRSQLIAGMLTFSLLFIVIIGSQLVFEVPFLKNNSLTWINTWKGYFQVFDHLSDFSRGIIDTRPFFLYFSNTILLLFVTVLIIRSKA